MPSITWEDVRSALVGRTPQTVATCTKSAAVALILRDGSPSGIDILFIHRATHPEDPWSGHMAFPGGRADEGETLLETAVRETAEEVGIDLRSAELLGALDEIQAMRRVPIDLRIAPFVFRVPADAAVHPSHEVAAALWLPLEDLVGERYRSTFDYTETGGLLELPCFRVEERVIWGLTYRMFGELEMRLRSVRPPAAS